MSVVIGHLLHQVNACMCVQLLHSYIYLNNHVLYLYCTEWTVHMLILVKLSSFQYAKAHSMRYFETSAKTGEQVQEAFHQICKDLLENNDPKLVIECSVEHYFIRHL